MHPSVTRWVSLAVTAGLAVAGLAVTASTGSARIPAPDHADGVQDRAGGVRELSAQQLGLSAPAETATQRFSLVGVTWPYRQGSEQVVVAKVRVRSHGVWSGWQRLTTTDAAAEPGGRSGTDPLWVDEADGIQAEITTGGNPVPDAKVVLVDPGERPGDAPAVLDENSEGVPQAVPRPAPYPMPRIVTRHGWGADEKLRARNGKDCLRPHYGRTVRVAVVHHTAGSNRYTARQSAAIVRSIYAYHVKGRGWCDLGYNFLVDRFGRIFEGRYGGMALPVRGAHAGGGYNTNTTGISLMGSFDKQRPTNAMMEATARVIAWKLDANYRRPRTRQWVAGHWLNAVSGHRDTKSTECPGRYVYSRLPWLRTRVDALMGRAIRTEIRDLAQRLGGERRIGPAFWGEHQVGAGRATWFGSRDITWSAKAGAHSLYGAFRTRYRQTGNGRGPLGFPVAEQDAGRVRGSQVQYFRSPSGGRAALYWSPATGAREVYGAIMRRYAGLGAERSRLRLPKGYPYSIPGGLAQEFQGGRIKWNLADNTSTVSYQ